jgi:SAM-dependent methyltransferase
MKLARQWLHGKGIELGRAAHNPLAPEDCFSVAPSDGVRCVDQRDLDDYRVYVEEQQRYGRAPARVDHVAEATGLPFASASLDYVASSHVLEHVPNLLGAWVECQRVLRPGGVNFAIVPIRTALSTDAARPVSRLNDLIRAYEQSITPEDLLPGQAWRGHYIVFTLQLLLDAVNWFNRQGLGCWLLEAVEEIDSNVGNGHTLVLSKQENLPDLADALPALDAEFGANNHVAAALLARQVLSLNFRVHEAWAMLGVSQYQLGDPLGAQESLRQALILQPGNADYQEFFAELSGAPFRYPPSLLEHLARLL